MERFVGALVGLRDGERDGASVIVHAAADDKTPFTGFTGLYGDDVNISVSERTFLMSQHSIVVSKTAALWNMEAMLTTAAVF